MKGNTAEEKTCKTVIDKANLIENSIKQENKKTGRAFNIFKILKAERKEVSTHSRFIYELLNKSGSHGQGDRFYQLFQNALGIDAGELLEVYREEKTVENNDTNRRVDFVLYTEKYVIGIEMKIDAKDLDHQLSDYYTHLKAKARHTGKSVLLYHLSLDGRKPDNISLAFRNDAVPIPIFPDSSNGADPYTVRLISFECHILDWLNRCVEEAKDIGTLREALNQYKNLIEKLTNQNMALNMEIVDLIIESPDNLKATLRLVKNADNAKKNVQLEFWRELYRQIDEIDTIPTLEFFSDSKAGSDIDTAVSNYLSKGKYTNYGYRCLVDKENNVYLYICLYHALHYGLRVVGSNKPKPLVSSEKEKFRKNYSGLTGFGWNAVANNKDDWIYAKYNQVPINFRNFNAAAISLADEETRNKVVRKMISEISSMVDIINSSPKRIS